MQGAVRRVRGGSHRVTRSKFTELEEIFRARRTRRAQAAASKLEVTATGGTAQYSEKSKARPSSVFSSSLAARAQPALSMGCLLSQMKDSSSPKSVAAVILGGGAGTRLYPLTKMRAKPAVPIGGAYRLIDVPMSNCINSGIIKIYVLTQARGVSFEFC